ncbi:protein translocase subunit SecD [bacterium (Candidatus Blackallbacteria) CG17_big_fil_post_rev_8_21_14_2_50_48_46]|uniref:Protein translocase subunit SecD n=1 Tax=bacterium (Candidatus Blackallbacteria) CG17_big_fil_post_rev_8_21_14_2_50_48_46 TaxID=2014261 RepID=A0A2M7G1N9_9BACT|nr:MAG: protein translocase subunit SecD [bacterium (Candidatus Blackallbacteria) CG18_big_fil_WC_8_21_14_2_50_49_26]PIW15447.1 MAG: protein translocase subunit SecD [bacterium (Candidatus Blackallbacteria) CG17_big_fil_post_rev_8_21_14_2_50_48_46]PIW49693.1 MAG: protein translocase subunit SecD [bacterium (Candidatus Blackallbacteria) CG13_big_fil_rev_8_21_14_2_50_49_14]
MANRDKFMLLFLIILIGVASWIIATKPIKQGLDIQGGIHLVVEAKDVKEKIVDNKVVESAVKVNPEVMLAAIAVVRQRVDGLGVAEPMIQLKGERQIIVELPGIKDPQDAVKLIGETAKLDFRRQDPKDPSKWVETGVYGKMLKDARANLRGASDWIIEFEFNKEGAQKFGDLTTELVGQPLGIFLDNKLVSSPRVNSPITGGSGLIEGGFTAEDAKKLAIQLKAGQLPVPLEMVENRTVGPTLGQEAVEKSFFAGMAGLFVVVIFMIWFYRIPGAVADIALVFYSLLNLAIFKLIPVTLTVPGIAGFILSIGMAVDANILIFERTKEELRMGKSIFNAVESGFQRAFSSIFDSNTTTLISCAVLYYFGTGLIRGFAVTLAIGVIISMFTAITVSRTLMRIVVRFKKMRNPLLYGVKPMRKQQTGA